MRSSPRVCTFHYRRSQNVHYSGYTLLIWVPSFQHAHELWEKVTAEDRTLKTFLLRGYVLLMLLLDPSIA